jgi:(p)ppGpp synthase/HD superfamily hydrolase
MVTQAELTQTANPKLGDRFDAAFRFASHAHRHQIRKGMAIPYLAHLLSVAALVLEAGGDEELAIAALLHDAAEDQGGQAMLDEIRSKFGDRVATVVEGCSDTLESPKPAWQLRKQAYIEHIRNSADLGTCVVSAADKLHNSRSILDDHYLIGDAVFDRFRKSKDHTLWYYRELVPAFRQAALRIGGSDPLWTGFVWLTDRFERVQMELESRAGKPGYDPCRA